MSCFLDMIEQFGLWRERFVTNIAFQGIRFSSFLLLSFLLFLYFSFIQFLLWLRIIRFRLLLLNNLFLFVLNFFWFRFTLLFWNLFSLSFFTIVQQWVHKGIIIITLTILFFNFNRFLLYFHLLNFWSLLLFLFRLNILFNFSFLFLLPIFLLGCFLNFFFKNFSLFLLFLNNRLEPFFFWHDLLLNKLHILFMLFRLLMVSLGIFTFKTFLAQLTIKLIFPLLFFMFIFNFWPWSFVLPFEVLFNFPKPFFL